jgi:hypothetical protein
MSSELLYSDICCMQSVWMHNLASRCRLGLLINQVIGRYLGSIELSRLGFAIKSVFCFLVLDVPEQGITYCLPICDTGA